MKRKRGCCDLHSSRARRCRWLDVSCCFPVTSCSFLSHSGKPSASGDLLLRLDLQSCLMEEHLQASAALNALQTNNSYQPVREGHIHEEKISPGTEHTRYLVYAYCLIVSVVERDGGESQVYRGTLERQLFLHACKEGGVGIQALCHLYHAVCRVYSDQVRLRPIDPGLT